MNGIRYISTKLDEKIDQYIDKTIDDKIINKNHNKIRKELNIDLQKFKLSKAIVKKLFLIFDKIYFKNLIQDKIYNNNVSLIFDISNKYKNVAGMCIYHGNKMEIIFSNYIITKIYNSKFKSIFINGLLCYDIVDVLINLMEHEITHLILFIYDRYKDDVKSGHNSQFKDIVYNMYRHTKITHDLLTGDIEEYNKCKEKACDEVKVGMKIECGKYSGIVVEIRNKYLVFNDNGKLRICKFNAYKIIDKNYKEYHDTIKKNKEKAYDEVKVGMKIECGNSSGVVVEIKKDYLTYKNDDKLKVCKFSEYKIIDENYEEYQNYIKELKEKLKIGVEIRCGKLYGPITKIINDKIYFKDELSSRIYWCLINFLDLL